MARRDIWSQLVNEDTWGDTMWSFIPVYGVAMKPLHVITEGIVHNYAEFIIMQYLIWLHFFLHFLYFPLVTLLFSVTCPDDSIKLLRAILGESRKG